MSTFDLRACCSRYFTFADLIECGETWNSYARAGTSIANLPVQGDTLDGIASLAREILDPLHEEFGSVALTYGFAGPALTRHIKGKISPPHDQHAGSELNPRGSLICARHGQACDIHVPGVNSLAVARWVQERLPFDRMYLYGHGRPLHVSYGPEGARKVYAMLPHERGRVPRDVSRRGWAEIGALFEPP